MDQTRPETPENVLDAELRGHLDRVRLENQRLHAQLAERSSLRHVLGLAAFHAAASVHGSVRTLRRRVPGGGSAYPRPAVPPSPTPYVVHRRHAPARIHGRVLHVIGNFHIGGSAHLVVDLVEHLDHCYEQAVVSWDVPTAPAYVGLPLEHCEKLTAARATDILRRKRPDLLHVHFLGHHQDNYSSRSWRWYRHWFTAAERLGIPVLENINIPTEPYVSDAVACYVHVSDYVRQHFGRRDGRHVTIYPGSDLNLFRRDPDRPRPEDCIGMVYRLDGDKVDEHAIEPFIEVVRHRPGTRALIVGGGRFLEPYRARVREVGLADAFVFTDYVAYDELPSLYAEMSLFVAPVYFESFGQVSAFAMGLELPVVGYRVGALEEITGDASVLAPPGDSTRLAEIIGQLLDDPVRRAAIGAANRKRAERLFSVETMIGEYRALYDELCAARRRRGSGRLEP
jgi:glycosyltransferase involved in cell wall biosynthesis